MVRVVPQNNNHFNPRTLQESATISSTCLIPNGTRFQSTHPTRECDDLIDLMQGNRQLFQSTHPTRECDGDAIVNGRDTGSFQSTHPTRECDRNI